jgi:hypothetical protein
VKKLPKVPRTDNILPPSGVIQERLGEAIRAERVLRQMMRAAMRAERDADLKRDSNDNGQR